ncbi:hypothetical protein PV433_27250 [Paenibacillus sp. GYB004]|uniref:hypothetical protein n=1 Tax=Paenibacillus sp. GYB004 TaxID=2994393 RepID=UPI002F96E0A2
MKRTKNLIAVRAKIRPMPPSTKTKIRAAIDYACNGGARSQFNDDEGVSYLVTYQEKRLIISIVDLGPDPNASSLSYLIGLLGEPSTKHAKPWVLDPKYTILLLFWENPSFNRVEDSTYEKA